MSIAQKSLRTELGNFNSVVCLKAIIYGVEEALGEKAAMIAMISAGRQRGKQLAEELGLTGKEGEISLIEIQSLATKALGKEGTRLCIIDKIVVEEEVYKVYSRETVCSFSEEENSPRQCTYTLGAIQGILEAFLSKRLRGKQTESVLRGSDYDVLEYTLLA
ncbi:MAG: hypothetical protein WA865_16845 [Spirulinaceae cyanobacterium]